MYSNRERLKLKNHDSNMNEMLLNPREILVLDEFIGRNVSEEIDPLSNADDSNNNEQETAKSEITTELQAFNGSSNNATKLKVIICKAGSELTTSDETWNESKVLLKKSTPLTEPNDLNNYDTTANVIIKEEVSDDTDSTINIKQELDIGEDMLNFAKSTIKTEISEITPQSVKKKVWICEICDIKLKSKAAFVIHQRTHYASIKYDCAHCDLCFPSKRILTAHMVIHKEYVCMICEAKCYLEASLSRHLQKHNLEGIENYVAQNIELGSSSVREESAQSDDENIAFKCKICNKQFTRKENLIFHIRGHIGSQSFQCNICNKTLEDKESLVNHIKTHSNMQKSDSHIETYTCEYCSSEYTSKFDLMKHRRIHFGKSSYHPKLNSVNVEANPDNWYKINERPYACHLCSRRYKNRYSLRSHLNDIHGPKIVRMCEICNKSYMTKKALQEHKENVHLKDKKHKCEICNKAFIAKHLVIRHMLKHTGEKNYQCEDCGKFFQMPYTLRLHRKIHLNDKSFQCHNCGKKFITKGNLQIHVQTHLKKYK